jgi:phosphotransferase system enzyme I (PtsI)
MPAATTRSDIRTYKGVGVSPGIAIGRAVIVEKRVAQVYRIPIRDADVEAEVRRFDEALEKTRDELLDLKQKVSRSMGEEYAQIFEAHAMIVGDASFADKVTQKIERRTGQCRVGAGRGAGRAAGALRELRG